MVKKAKKGLPDTSAAMLALHLNADCDASCGYCIIDRAAEILAASKRRPASTDTENSTQNERD